MLIDLFFSEIQEKSFTQEIGEIHFSAWPLNLALNSFLRLRLMAQMSTMISSVAQSIQLTSWLRI
jgi:hypothetical protein